MRDQREREAAQRIADQARLAALAVSCTLDQANRVESAIRDVALHEMRQARAQQDISEVEREFLEAAKNAIEHENVIVTLSVPGSSAPRPGLYEAERFWDTCEAMLAAQQQGEGSQ